MQIEDSILATTDPVTSSLNVTDSIIIIFFTFFVASTVNERIIDFIKAQFPGLWMKPFNFQDEIKRRRRIWTLSFSFGCLSSIFIDVNLFKIVIENKTTFKEIGGLFDRLEDTSFKGTANFIGYLFSGIFISLGSKFWHDLLDVTLSIRRARNKIRNFDPRTIDDIEQIDEYLDENEYEIALKALETHRNRLKGAYGKNSEITVGYDSISNQYRLCIQVFNREVEINKEESNEASRFTLEKIAQKVVNEIKHFSGKIKRISYTTNYGYVFRFPVLEYFPGKATTVTDNKIQAGGGIFHSSSQENIGTFGCLVKHIGDESEEVFLLTCYHCVRPLKGQKWMSYNRDEDQGKIFYKSYINSKKVEEIGRIYIGNRNATMDIALIKATVDQKYLTDYHLTYNRTIPKGSDNITFEDAKNRREIRFSGVKTEINIGYIVNYSYSTKVRYADGPPHTLNNLIMFSASRTKPYIKPCDKGDSGAIILDNKDYKALGMIVATDKNFGYAIPIKNILDEYGLCLYQDTCFDKELNNKILT